MKIIKMKFAKMKFLKNECISHSCHLWVQFYVNFRIVFCVVHNCQLWVQFYVKLRSLSAFHITSSLSSVLCKSQMCFLCFTYFSSLGSILCETQNSFLTNTETIFGKDDFQTKPWYLWDLQKVSIKALRLNAVSSVEGRSTNKKHTLYHPNSTRSNNIPRSKDHTTLTLPRWKLVLVALRSSHQMSFWDMLEKQKHVREPMDQDMKSSRRKRL